MVAGNRRALALAALVLLLVVALVMGRRSRPEPSLAAAGPRGNAAAGGPYDPRVERAAAATASARATKPPRSTDSRPIIDEVSVEKPELCVGEESLVTVRAHTPDDADAELHYTIGPGTGQSVPLRAWLDEDNEPIEYQISVFGRDNAVTTLTVPRFRVKNCELTLHAALTQRVLPNRWGSYEFEAHIAGGDKPAAGASPFVPKRYAWSFGDGSESVTRTPVVVHGFEERAQSTLYSQFLVRVEITSGDGRTLVARSALQLLNPAYESLTRKGIVTLLVALDPVFPVAGPEGIVSQRVRLRHHSPGPVTIESVRVLRQRAGSLSAEAEPLDVSSVLGTSQIPPGRGLELEVKLDPKSAPGVVAANYYLEGRSADGMRALGSFAVMLPAQAPTKDDNLPVEDPMMRAKIQAARRLLGKPIVSDEDLWRLEREGKFAAIRAGSSSESAAPARR